MLNALITLIFTSELILVCLMTRTLVLTFLIMLELVWNHWFMYQTLQNDNSQINRGSTIKSNYFFLTLTCLPLSYQITVGNKRIGEIYIVVLVYVQNYSIRCVKATCGMGEIVQQSVLVILDSLDYCPQKQRQRQHYCFHNMNACPCHLPLNEDNRYVKTKGVLPPLPIHTILTIS